MVCATPRVQDDSPDFSNPVASRPKYRSSIHHAICLMKNIKGRMDRHKCALPNAETVIREFILSAKFKSFASTHCPWILASLRQRVSQLINESTKQADLRPESI